MNKTIVKNGLVLIEGEFRKRNLILSEGKIVDIYQGEQLELGENLKEIDGEGYYIIPGFIDIHTHGAVGQDVNNTTALGLEEISRFFAQQGTTTWLASLLTDSEEHIEKSINEILKHQKTEGVTGNLFGIHLEGPFLSHEYKGSMPEYFLREYDSQLVSRYQQIAQGQIKYMTVAPEVEGVLEHIPQLTKEGIQVSLGHSGVTYEKGIAAVKAGAKASTHTFNAMGLFHQHHPGMMGVALETDIYCEAICDGRHLHPGAIRLLLKTKGLERVILITDSIMAAGLQDGEYQLGVNEIVVKNGDAKLKNQDVRAGSTLTMAQALKNMLAFTDLSLAEIVPLMSENPAKLLKIDDQVGTIAVGKLANLVFLDQEMTIKQTFIKGKKQ